MSTQERVVGGDSVGPSVGPVVQGRKEKDKQERSERKNKGLSSSP